MKISHDLRFFLFFLLFIFSFLPLITAQENTAILCADGIDNDQNGLVDCEDFACQILSNEGCQTCSSGLSFADEVISYTSGCPIADPEPNGALGTPDYAGASVDAPDFVFLGQGGQIQLAFTNNLLTNSGDNQDDIYIFEVGAVVEAMNIALRPANPFTIQQLQINNIPDADANGFYEVGLVSGATSAFDVDAIIPGYGTSQLVFDAIEINDVDDAPCGTSGAPGADIDAVCAIFSVIFDCAGTPNGTAVVDDCGICLEISDPAFNQSCLDCAGTINGMAIVDSCGICLPPNDPAFNQSCADCSGTPNGSAVIDSCGVCLPPLDPSFNQACSDCAGVLNGTAVLDSCGVCLQASDSTFNQSCLDCAGVVNGMAVVDSCGVCLPPNNPAFNQSCADCRGTPNGFAVVDSCGVCLPAQDSLFNQSCSDCAGIINGNSFINECGDCITPNAPSANLPCSTTIYFPNVFSPNLDGINDRYAIFKHNRLPAEVVSYQIYDRWGELIYEANNFSFSTTSNWWDGTFRGKKMQTGVFLYKVQLSYSSGRESNHVGSFTLVR